MRLIRGVTLMVLAEAVFALPACGDDHGDDGCHEGDHTIAGESDVSELEPYTCINGSLHMENTALTSFELPNLERIDGDLDIYSNAALTSLAGLSDLLSVGGNLAIQINDSLTSLDMYALSEVGGGISIIQNFNLPQCDACDLVEQVGGEPQGINGNLQQDSCSNYFCL